MRTYKLLALLLAALAGAALVGQSALSRAYVPPVIMYHSVRPHPDKADRLAVSSEAFERQMRFLRQWRYRVVPLEELAALVKSGKKVPSRTLAITFDDGYKDNYTYAFPVLRKYGIPATLFVITDEVGRPQGDRLSWGEIKEMQDSGLVTVGSHCLGPEPLVKIKSEDEVRRQIFDSRKILEQRLGREVVLFSYPEGMFNARIRQMVIEAGYKAAVATNPGRAYPNDDPFALKRLRVSSSSDNLFVFWAETSGYYTFMKERRHR